MKARIRKTGEIVDIISYAGITKRADNDFVSYIDSYGVEFFNQQGLNYYWDFSEVEEISLVDWNAKLIELSGMAMQGFCSNTDPHSSKEDELAMFSIMQAKELIKQLKEELK